MKFLSLIALASLTFSADAFAQGNPFERIKKLGEEDKAKTPQKAAVDAGKKKSFLEMTDQELAAERTKLKTARERAETLIKQALASARAEEKRLLEYNKRVKQGKEASLTGGQEKLLAEYREAYNKVTVDKLTATDGYSAVPAIKALVEGSETVEPGTNKKVIIAPIPAAELRKKGVLRELKALEEALQKTAADPRLRTAIIATIQKIEAGSNTYAKKVLPEDELRDYLNLLNGQDIVRNAAKDPGKKGYIEGAGTCRVDENYIDIIIALNKSIKANETDLEKLEADLKAHKEWVAESNKVDVMRPAARRLRDGARATRDSLRTQHAAALLETPPLQSKIDRLAGELATAEGKFVERDAIVAGLEAKRATLDGTKTKVWMEDKIAKNTELTIQIKKAENIRDEHARVTAEHCAVAISEATQETLVALNPATDAARALERHSNTPADHGLRQARTKIGEVWETGKNGADLRNRIDAGIKGLKAKIAR